MVNDLGITWLLLRPGITAVAEREWRARRTTRHGDRSLLPRGRRPAPLSEVAGWQVKGARHSGKQLIDDLPSVQILDAPMPQMVGSVLDFFRSLDLPVAEQVLAVPKISFDCVPQRLVERRLPQMVEQLVEVPTVVSYSSLLQRTVEQTVDIPASRGRGRRGGLQGFFPGQSTTAAAVDIPVPLGDLPGFLPGQVSTASSSHSPVAENEAGKVVFRTFPRGKKVRRPQPSRVRSCPPVSAHGRGRLMRTWMLRTSRRRWRTTGSPCLRRRERPERLVRCAEWPRVAPVSGIGSRAALCGNSRLRLP